MAKAKKTAATEDQTVDTVESQQSAQAPVQLTVSDLQILGQIVDLASRRGAFQAGELVQVGAAYNKLTSFLAYVDSTTAKAPEEGTPE